MNQIFRKIRNPLQNRPGLGVFQRQKVCVQRLAPEAGQCSLALGAEMAGLGFEMRAIDAVAQQGMADMGEMHPDLMGAPGLELAGQQCGDGLAVAPLKGFLNFPVGDRLTAALLKPTALRCSALDIQRRCSIHHSRADLEGLRGSRHRVAAITIWYDTIF